MEIPENSVNVGATEANRLIYLFKERYPAAVDGLEKVADHLLIAMLKKAVLRCGGDMIPMGWKGWIFQFTDKSFIRITPEGVVSVQ